MADNGSISFEIYDPVIHDHNSEFDLCCAFIDWIKDFMRTELYLNIRIAFSVLVSIFLLYLLVAHCVLDVGDLDVKNIGIPDMNVKYTIIDDSSVSVEANVSLRLRFIIKGYIEPYADLGIFNLTTISNASTNPQGFSVFSRSAFQASTTEQLIKVKFKSNRVVLTEDKIELFQKSLQKGMVMIVVRMDFKWNLKKKKWLVFPEAPRHIRFECTVPYYNLPIHEKYVIKCEHQ